MKTKTITVCEEAIMIDVICEYINSADIFCGEEPSLGYCFYVSSDENINEIEKNITLLMKKYNRPLINIEFRSRVNINIDWLWDMEKIEKCIKENEF
jgi:hypothetical protein